MTDETNYSNYPKSFTELRHERVDAQDGDAWGILKPRDLLISVLRRIDAGEINPHTMAIAFKEQNKTGTTTSVDTCGDMGYFQLLGMLTRAIHIIGI